MEPFTSIRHMLKTEQNVKSFDFSIFSAPNHYDPLPLMRTSRSACLCPVFLFVCKQLQNSWRKGWPTCTLVSYIFDAVWLIEHPSHSHLRLFLSLIYNVRSKYPPTTSWIWTLQLRRGCKTLPFSYVFFSFQWVWRLLWDGGPLPLWMA